jgi:hypothetical protein
MALAAGIVTWAVAARMASGPIWQAALIALAGVYVAMPLVGAIGYAITRGDLTWIVTAFAHFAISPFTLAAALVAAAVVAGFRALAAQRQ